MQMCKPACKPNELPAKKDFPKWSEDLQEWFIYHTFALAIQQKGSLAQLVQSVCLTSRGSGVRIPQLPLSWNHPRGWFFYAEKFWEHSSVGLERLLDKQEVSGSNPLVPTNENQTVAEMQLSDFYVCYSRVFQRFSAAGLSRKSNRETTWRQLCAFCAASQKCLQTEQICWWLGGQCVGCGWRSRLGKWKSVRREGAICFPRVVPGK